MEEHTTLGFVEWIALWNLPITSASLRNEIRCSVTTLYSITFANLLDECTSVTFASRDISVQLTLDNLNGLAAFEDRWGPPCPPDAPKQPCPDSSCVIW